IRLRSSDGQADASLVSRWNAIVQLLPRRAGIDRLVDRAARPAAVEAVGLAQELIGRGVEHVRVARIDHDVGRAGERVDVEHFGPGASRIARLEDAALGITGPEVAGGRDVRDVRVRRIEDDASNRARVMETDVRPRVAGVGRAIDTAAPRRALAIVLFARSGPDD